MLASLPVPALVPILGGLTFALYTLAISMAQDDRSDEEEVSAVTLMMMANGLGSIVGPLLVGLAFSTIGDGGYYAVLSISGLGAILGAGRRISRVLPLR